MAYYSIPSKSNLDNRHDAVGAWFLGPRAENFNILKEVFESTLASQDHARKTIYKDDKDFITPEMQTSKLFLENIKKLKFAVRDLAAFLARSSVPFWSPRYQAHMSMESSFPAVIGYLSTILYNPNNVATEASPFTTYLEKTVGLQLCKMLGFNTLDSISPKAWGHITCDGSVANLESIWAARNLKFYPLSLKLAILEGDLRFIANLSEPYTVELCNGQKKPFMECSTWELLNLKPSTVLEIPQKLFDNYDHIEKVFKIEKLPVYFVGTTKHYSWPKGAAIAGIGSGLVKDVPVDNSARMDAVELDKMLAECIKAEKEDERTPVYAVVAIMGSTEQGAVDPLAAILELRTKYQEKGLSFVVHCDGAWGGYFASMIHDRKHNNLTTLTSIDSDTKKSDSRVPVQALTPYTADQLAAYPGADSITIDPHKSGYTPYPAGGLCYRDERMRYLVTWTSPIVYHGDDSESIGVYGVEGSKPGAAPVSAWLSHEVIGLHEEGYGTLLGEATFTCTKLYSHWVTMTIEKSDLIVVPFNMLPAEKVPHPDHKEIEAQRIYIRDHIANRSNDELILDPPAMEFMATLGSDLMINAFACNFWVNGKVNEDVVEANYLNQRIFQRTAMTKTTDKAEDYPIILTSTTLAQSAYKGCLTNFKDRLGLKGDQDLFVLINVTMTPWPTANGFLQTIVRDFRKIADEEVKNSLKRNTLYPDKHGFIMQGTDKLHLVHLPMFYMENHRYQLIITGDLPEDVAKIYIEAKADTPEKFLVLGNVDDHTLFGEDPLIKEGGSFKAVMFRGLPGPGVEPLAENFTLSNIKIVVKESISSNALSATYPTQMPFYLYGTPEQQHIDHFLHSAPNIQLNSDIVKLDLKRPLSKEDLASGLVAVFTNVYENSLQPMISKDNDDTHDHFESQGFTFAPHKTFAVSIYPPVHIATGRKSFSTAASSPITVGTLTLGASVYADDMMINMDGAKEQEPERSVAEKVSTFQLTTEKVNSGMIQPTPIRADVSGLVAEHPIEGGRLHVETRNRWETMIMKEWESEWNQKRNESVEELYGREE